MLCPMHMKLKHVERAIDIQPALITLDHKKPEIPLKIDNYMTEGFVSSGMKQKCSKKRDMIWHLLRDKEVLEQLRVYWVR